METTVVHRGCLGWRVSTAGAFGLREKEAKAEEGPNAWPLKPAHPSVHPEQSQTPLTIRMDLRDRKVC